MLSSGPALSRIRQVAESQLARHQHKYVEVSPFLKFVCYDWQLLKWNWWLCGWKLWCLLCVWIPVRNLEILVVLHSTFVCQRPGQANLLAMSRRDKSTKYVHYCNHFAILNYVTRKTWTRPIWEFHSVVWQTRARVPQQTFLVDLGHVQSWTIRFHFYRKSQQELAAANNVSSNSRTRLVTQSSWTGNGWLAFGWVGAGEMRVMWSTPSFPGASISTVTCGLKPTFTAYLRNNTRPEFTSMRSLFQASHHQVRPTKSSKTGKLIDGCYQSSMLWYELVPWVCESTCTVQTQWWMAHNASH